MTNEWFVFDHEEAALVQRVDRTLQTRHPARYHLLRDVSVEFDLVGAKERRTHFSIDRIFSPHSSRRDDATRCGKRVEMQTPKDKQNENLKITPQFISTSTAALFPSFRFLKNSPISALSSTASTISSHLSGTRLKGSVASER